MAEFWLNTIKWFTELTPQKGLIALLAGGIIFSQYTIYDNKAELKELQTKYDKVASDRTADSKECRTKIDSLNNVWIVKFDAYRNEKEGDIKAIAKDNQEKLDRIQQKIFDLQFKTDKNNN